MIKPLALLLVAMLPNLTAAQVKRVADSQPLVFNHVTVIDMTGAPPQPDMTVVLTGTRITDIGKAGRVRAPKNAQAIDATGKFLIPGLWDMHVHLAKAGENALPLFLVNGVTSVRDMGGDYAEVLKWRKQAETGERLAPRIKTAGAILESAQHVERMKRGGTVETVEKTRIPIATPEEARKAVALMASLGVDFIKVRTVASPETYKAIIEEAKRKGLMVVGHQIVSPDVLIEAGQKSVEHTFFPPVILNPKHAEIYKRMAERGVHVVPTIVVAEKSLLVSYDDAKLIVGDMRGKIDFRRKYLSGYLIEDWKEQLEEKKQPPPFDLAKLKDVLIKEFQEMHKAGVRLMPGTDVAVLLIYPGYTLHDELKLLAQFVGLTPMEALVSATRYPSEFFGMQDTLGTIERGKIADLVLLDANPLDDISNTKRIAAVVSNGRYLPKPTLERMLADVEVAARAVSHTEEENETQNGVEQELRRLEDEWLNSYTRGERETFDRIVADDFTGTDESAKVRSKAQERELIQAAPGPAGVTLTNEDVRIRIYGDTAVVTGRIVSKVQSGGGANINFQSRFTDTFLKRQGRWQVVARHYSRLPPERTAVRLDPKIYDAYTGQYELAPNVVFDVKREGDKLMSRVTGQPAFELLPESEIAFFLKEVPAQILFLRDETGQVARLIILQDGRIIPAKRVK